jgi:class 3 adenylate cyclase
MGREVSRNGDWHGHPVNVASRLADCAPPGRVYVSEEVANVASGRFRYVGRRRLKGLSGGMPVFLLVTGDPAGDGSAHAATS